MYRAGVNARLFAYLSYRDPDAAIRWLEAVGFAVTSRQEDDAGTVQHAELRQGDAVVMLATDTAGYDVPALRGSSTGGGLYLLVDDVDDLYRRALDAGGSSVFPPEDTEWGSRRARVLDPGGLEWSFGGYEPGLSW